jgi:hypothetical protein
MAEPTKRHLMLAHAHLGNWQHKDAAPANLTMLLAELIASTESRVLEECRVLVRELCFDEDMADVICAGFGPPATRNKDQGNG